uniref:Zinc finger DBF-type containing 2 n=1 Tax=Suricata suricatta TaxID=37032 RepID=A0A673T2Y7_SURSU
MQNRQGYCSYCCVRYFSLEQHVSSAQHRYLTSQNRQQIGPNSLMERFLQDVIRHHPYHSQESRSMQNERLLTNMVSPAASPPEVVPVDDCVSEEMTDDTASVQGESSTKGFEPSKELYSRPSTFQEYIQGVSVRPSVIQKLEKGQQQPLEFVDEIGSGRKEFNAVGIGQATSNRQSLICPSVISSAPASCIPGSSYDRPVTTKTTRSPAAASLDPVRKCDPDKGDRYLEQPYGGSRNSVLSSIRGTSSVSYQKPKESDRTYLCTNSDKLIIQEDVKSQHKTLLSGAKVREFVGTEGSLKSASLSKLAIHQPIKVNTTGMPSYKGLFEDAAAKHREKFFSGMDQIQKEKLLGFNKSAFLEQKNSVISETKFARGSFHSSSNQLEEAAQDFWREEQVDQENRYYDSRASELSFDCNSFYSLTEQSRVTAEEINILKEEYADMQCKYNESYVSEVSSDGAASLQLATNRTQVIVKGVSVQKAKPVRLVDESYESSDSEINFDCDALPQSTNDYTQQPAKEVNMFKEEHLDLVDKNYGSSSSEISTDSSLPLQPVGDQLPVTVTEAKLHVGLVDDNYGSSCSETSTDNDVALQSLGDHPQLVVEERNLQDRHVYLKNKGYTTSSANEHLDYAVSLDTVTDVSQRALEEIHLEEKNEPGNMNYDSHGSEMSFHTDARLVASQSGVIVKKVSPREVTVDLENKSVRSSNSDQSFDSNAFLYQSASDQRQGALGEISLKELNVDIEVKSYGCSSSELTFESDPPVKSGTEQSEMDIEEIRKRHINLEDHCGSNSSGITFDSDSASRSGGDQSQVAIYVEEPSPLENKMSKSYVPEGAFDFGIPVHSGMNQPGLAIKEVIVQKEEYIHLGKKNDEPRGSEISLDFYVSPHSVINPPEVALEKLINLQQEEHLHLENKGNGPGISEIILKPDISFHLVADHTNIKEHINLQDTDNGLSVYETSLDSGVHCHQSVTHKPEMSVKEIWLQKEKLIKFKSKSAKFSGSETGSDVPHYVVAEPQIAVKEISVQKEEPVLEPHDKYSSSGIMFDADIPPQSMTETPHIAVLKEGRVDLEGDSTPLTGQFQEVVRRTTLWKEEEIGLQSKVFETSGSKLVHGFGVSLQPVADQPWLIVKQVNHENEGHVNVEEKHSQCGRSAMSLDSDFLVQSVVDQPQITNLDQDHFGLEEKHSQSGGSEISFDSEDPLQSVADQVRKIVKEINLWKDEGDEEDKRDKSKGFEIVYDSDILFQSVAGETEEVIKEINLWKEHVDLQGKIVEPVGSKINFDSNEPLQSVGNVIQETVTGEINLLREGHVCLDDKGYEPNDSEIIYVSDIPLQSVVEQPHILEREHVNLEDKSNVSCPEITFISDDHLQSVADQLQKSVKEVRLWKEDHIYLEDKSYKLGDFEVGYDSDIPIRFVADQSSLTVKELSSQKRGHNDLENKGCGPSVAEIKCDSGVHFQLEVDQSQVVCKEIDLPKERHLGMEVKSSEPSDSEMMCDSDVPLEIVVNEVQVSVKEANLRKMLFVDVVTNDSDCEVIAESDIPFQPVIDSSHVTVRGVDCINTEGFDLGESSDSSDSEVGYVCGASSQSMTNEAKETFRVVNQKKDYIILQEASCESYGSEIKFQIDPPDRSVTYASQGSDKETVKLIEEKTCGSDNPKTNFKWEDHSKPVTNPPPKASRGGNICQRKEEKTGRKDKYSESRASAGARKASAGSAGRQRAGKGNQKVKHADWRSTSCEPCGSGMNFQSGRSLQPDTGKRQEAANKKEVCKKRSGDLKEKKRDTRSGPILRADSPRTRGKAKEVIEDNPDEPVLEALPHVPPSFVGKTWSQIMREDDMKINALVKEFKEGRFHCYFDDDCETRKVKKKNLNKGKMITWADVSQDTTAIQVFSDHDDNADGISDTDDFSVALDKPSHHPTAKRPYEQSWRVASRCQAVKVSHGTQTNLTKETKGSGPEEDLTTRKRLLLQKDRKMKNSVQIGTLEFPEKCTKVLKPLQPNALVYVISSNMKFQNGESKFSKKYLGGRSSQDVTIEYKYKRRPFDYYDPLNKKIITNPPESDRNNGLQIHLDLSSSSDEDGPAEGFDPTGILTLRDELMACPRACISPEPVPRSGTSRASEVPVTSNFQSTPANRDAAGTSPKSATRKILQSKKKIQRRNMKTSALSFLQKVYKPIALQPKTRIASEKQSTWIRTKLSDIISKYISKYSVFLRRKYQSRSAFIRLHLKKKKCDITKLKKVKKPAKMLLSPPGQLEVPSCSPKPPVQDSWPAAGRKRNGKKRYRKRRINSSRRAKIHALRSLNSQVPMRTRLSDKLQADEAAKSISVQAR